MRIQIVKVQINIGKSCVQYSAPTIEVTGSYQTTWVLV